MTDTSITETKLTPAQIGIQYHQAAFDYLHSTRHGEIESALLGQPARLRVEILRRLVPQNEVLDGPTIWPAVRTALDEIESEMKAVLERRSVPFWLHLYRRIGVFLHSGHDDKRDARTLGLVRDIVELAISKHGIAEEGTELSPSTHLNAKKVLGGILAQAVRSSSSKPYSALKSLARYLEAIPPQMVIRDFVPEDFVGLYYVEGLAYQYWKICALLRSLGKGAKVEFNSDGEWRYHTSLAFDALIVSIDQRTEHARMESSLIGVWFRSELEQKSSLDPLLIVPVYNIERAPADDIFRHYGLDLQQPLISNFLPAILDITPYLEAHGEFSDALRRKHGFGLAAIILTILAFNRLALFPFESMSRFSEERMQSLLKQYTFNLCQRGYRVAHIAEDDQFGLVRLLMRTIKSPVEVPDEEIRLAIEFLRLSPPRQSQISLWSGGPRFLSMPLGRYHSLIDAHPIAAILQTLFYRVQHDASKRGTLFEDEFRYALERMGFQPQSGELHAYCGEVREADAAIKIETTLVLFECVSVERPIDYEIGNPKTLASRQERLEKKVGQVLSLAEFIRSNPVGKNYDFHDVENIEAYVISPFYEWIWELSDRLWVNGRPRIMAATEALEFLQSFGAAKFGSIRE